MSTTTKPLSKESQKEIDDQKDKANKEKQIERIIEQFKRLDIDLQNAILAEATTMKETTTIVEFNGIVGDLLKFIINISKQNQKYSGYDFSGFETLFRTGTKADAKIAISNFTMVSLPVADKILFRDDGFFLNTFDPSQIDSAIEKKGSGLNIFTSDKFKELWKKLDSPYKNHIFEKAGILVYKGFVYFAQISGLKCPI